MSDRCFYQDYFKKFHASALNSSTHGSISTLQVDDSGKCIFHSQDIIWKHKNGFKQLFLQLVQLLNDDNTLEYYDFRDFVFVGDEPKTTNSSERHVLHIAGTVFRKPVYFTGSSFIDSFELDAVDFQEGAKFRKTTFAGDLRVTNTQFQGLEFSNTTFVQLAYFINVEFLSYALFENTRFTGTTSGYVVKFKDSRFYGITDFSGSTFNLGSESTVGFTEVLFKDFTDFGNTQFHSQVIFSKVSFGFDTEFIDTSFKTISSSARYSGAAVEFNQIEILKDVTLTFRSTDTQNKMFNHSAQFSFKGDLDGTIQFENVNFNNINSASRERLVQLAKSGKVEIGPGCIKYRFQTDLRTIVISHDNAPLVLEICQTFTNYFSVSNGFNLGFEIVGVG